VLRRCDHIAKERLRWWVEADRFALRLSACKKMPIHEREESWRRWVEGQANQCSFSKKMEVDTRLMGRWDDARESGLHARLFW